MATATPSIQQFLGQANIAYSLFSHEVAFTAQEEAAVTHTPGRDWAKVVVCFVDDEPIQAVLPAPAAVNLDQLRELAGARTIRLAREDELKRLFPDCEVGAMPPLGPLYKQRVFVDAALMREPEIVFNAGTHTDAIRMRSADLALVTKPIVGHFGLESML
ncbi:MAG: YbaK/EbsC family protein [Acidobacteria bacterium]|nr:YbaK/EbsC family protein [Acidobacteriota bacterium]